MAISANNRLTLLFGGTFDPVHIGHLRSAIELRELLGAEEVRFIPCGQPVHKSQVIAPAQLRLAMLSQAVENIPGLVVDDIEIRRDKPSYSVDTIRYFAEQKEQERRLAWVMGADAFEYFTHWHRWQDILSMAHLVVLHRAGDKKPALPQEIRHQFADWSATGDLYQSKAGEICTIALTPWPVSSTAIRQKLRNGQAVDFLVPDSTLKTIKQYGVYG